MKLFSLHKKVTSPPLPAKSTAVGLVPKELKEKEKVSVDALGRIIVKQNIAFTKKETFNGTKQLTGSSVLSSEETDNELLFGYSTLRPDLELSVEEVDEVVSLCVKELVSSGLEIPNYLSSKSLYMSERTNALIRDYLADPSLKNLYLSPPSVIATFMKWSLARLVNESGERGFLPWEIYDKWMADERSASYPPHFFTELVGGLDRHRSSLLSNLLDLFSRTAAHSVSNGLSLRKTSSLFCLYLFGAEDLSFDETYAYWQRATDALEHILLAYIRNLQLVELRIPSHLEPFIQNYPLQVNFFNKSGNGVPSSARLQEFIRISRISRFNSRNLITSAGTWDVPASIHWPLFFSSSVPSSSSLSTLANSLPLFSSEYRHQLNIQSNYDEEVDGESQRFKSKVDSEWTRFNSVGFSETDATRLSFDLSEGERKSLTHRNTMQWGTFAESGFGGRESYLPEDLKFEKLSDRVGTWPILRADLAERLRETESLLPDFKYDTTPSEKQSLFIDSDFPEAYLTAFVTQGWKTDELKSSFVIVQWKSRPKPGEARSAGADDRSVDRWVLIEEEIPTEYRDNLIDGKLKKAKNRRISFLRVGRKSTPIRSSPLVVGPLLPLAPTTPSLSTMSVQPPRSPTATIATNSSVIAQGGHSPPNRVPVDYSRNGGKEGPTSNGSESEKVGFMKRLTLKRKGRKEQTADFLPSSATGFSSRAAANLSGNNATNLDRNASTKSHAWANFMTQETFEKVAESTSSDSLPPVPPPKPVNRSPTLTTTSTFTAETYPTTATQDGYDGIDSSISAKRKILYKGTTSTATDANGLSPIGERRVAQPSITLTKPDVHSREKEDYEVRLSAYGLANNEEVEEEQGGEAEQQEQEQEAEEEEGEQEGQSLAEVATRRL